MKIHRKIIALVKAKYLIADNWINLNNQMLKKVMLISGLCSFFLSLSMIYLSFYHIRLDKKIMQLKVNNYEILQQQGQLQAQLGWDSRPVILYKKATSVWKMHSPKNHEIIEFPINIDNVSSR